MAFTNSAYFLALLVVLPAVAGVWFAGYRSRLAARKKYGDGKLVDPLSSKPSLRLELLNLGAWLVAATLVVVGSAGPVLKNNPERIPTGDLQVVVVMDVSKSMGAEDYRNHMPADAGTPPDVNQPWGSRLDMAKYQIRRIMKDVQGNQLGLVTYTGDGWPQADLTSDFHALGFVLDNWVTLGSAPGGGSDFALGMREALEMFKRDADPAKKKVIVLISDGGYTGKPDELAKVLADINSEGVKLVVVGIGMPGDNPIPIYQNGQLKGFTEKEGKTVVTSFDEDALRHVVSATDGQYHHVSTEAGAHKIAIDWAMALGGSRVEYRESPVYHYFVGVGLAILCLLSITGLASKRARS